MTLFWSGVTLGHLKVDPKAKSWDCPCEGPTLVSGYNGNFCSPMMFILVNRAAYGHTRFQCTLVRFLSGTLLLSSGLRFRSNDHSLKHAYSLRPCSSSTTRGPYMLGVREAPGGILGSLGSPRGYASGLGRYHSLHDVYRFNAQCIERTYHWENMFLNIVWLSNFKGDQKLCER